MPRERVQHGKLYLHTPQPGAAVSDLPGDEPVKVTEWHPGMDVPVDSTLHEQPSLDVMWNRDGGWVQIGFNAPREWWEDLAETYDEEHSPGVQDWSAWTDVLSRQEINHMIRTLRRARDLAYGKDE